MIYAAFLIAISVVTPCPTDDSLNCRWNASERGNGKGDSYIAMGSEESAVIILGQSDN